jgi:DNA-binding LytR/AlgR family response regulator
MSNKPVAIIADDEEQLRTYLKTKLAQIWPDLVICNEAKNGIEAIDQINECRPDIAFLDIQMPGLTGIEVARKIAGKCWIVFITAYDKYAVEAFESEAIDYLLKPVTTERLEKTVSRLKERVETQSEPPQDFSQIVEKLISNMPDKSTSEYLKWIRAQHGDGIRLIQTDDIIYFKSEDKYTCVKTKTGESLISKPIKELAKELDPEKFWQIHRSTIVSVASITKVSRSLTGRHIIKLKNISEPLTVSRTYSHLFKQM